MEVSGRLHALAALLLGKKG